MPDFAKVIAVRNVNQAVSVALPYLLSYGLREESRNGTVLVAPGPVLTVYEKPQERVLFSPLRDANPFFHLMECLWMMAGRNDLAFPAYFNKRFAEYSDDGDIVWSAYGDRWRKFFGYDQLLAIVGELRTNAESRRAVLSMWNPSPNHDFEPWPGMSDNAIAAAGGKDVSCNTHAYFDLRGGVLNMTVCNRSNDAIWGAYGANAVHFSFMQEYVAAHLGVPVGVYRQFSNNFHAYTNVYNLDQLDNMGIEAGDTDYYTSSPSTIKPTPIITAGETIAQWDADLANFMAAPGVRDLSTAFFNTVAIPMYNAWKERKDGRGDGLGWLVKAPETDWRFAAFEWIGRRNRKKVA